MPFWAAFLAASVIQPTLAETLPSPPPMGHVETTLTIPSQMLGHDVTYALYLPPPRAHETEPAQPLPVLYLLHGLDDNHLAWLDLGHIATTLDRLIASGQLQPLAVVMPMGGNSWYVDDARSTGPPGQRGFGPMAAALADDVIPAIERRHHVGACRQARAIGGLSMGGFGAMVQALTHPDRYAAAISLSGSLFSDRDEDMRRAMPFYTQMFPGIYGEPFDPARFKSWTVFQRLEAAPAPVAAVGFWLAAGDRDFSGIVNGTVRLHQALRTHGIETHLRITDGEHNWALWSTAIEPALLWLSPKLHGGCR